MERVRRKPRFFQEFYLDPHSEHSGIQDSNGPARSPVPTIPNTQLTLEKVPSIQMPRPVNQKFATTKGPTTIVAPTQVTEEVLQLAVPEAEVRALLEEPVAPTTDGDAIPVKWISSPSNKNISTAIGVAPNYTCQYCAYEYTSRKWLLIHVRLHWVHQFCPCGYSSRWHETVRKHQVDDKIPASKKKSMKQTGPPTASGKGC